MWTLNLFIVTLTFNSCYGWNTHEENNDWDLLIFTQHWPVTVCQEWEEKKSTHSCSLPKDKKAWTIHGIWPTRDGTIGPQYCNTSWPFHPEEIKSIENAMNDKWINIEKETSTYSLWAHEWTKHGTCAAKLPALDTQLKYFTEGINFLNNYTMTNILSSSGIVPSSDKEYQVIDFHNAIKAQLKVDPIVECRSMDGKNYIFELRICFNKSLELADCDEINSARRLILDDQNSVLTNCDIHKGILYLPKVPQRVEHNVDKGSFLVDLYKLITWLHWFTL